MPVGRPGDQAAGGYSVYRARWPGANPTVPDEPGGTAGRAPGRAGPEHSVTVGEARPEQAK